ncbi:MAG: DUF4388 domain-containing protein [Nitrospira sp.]|nr:DUF4388 domain-containing protein [bacterium]MBL7049699.1 DUF4388 domain-containing protein [Nitrospira sp.]
MTIESSKDNKRQFTRYKKQTDCEIQLGDVTYTGKVVDYSDGISILTKDNPDFVKGAHAEIMILENKLTLKGEIVWTQNLGYHIKAGFRRLCDLRGSFHYYRLSDILLGISRSGRTGVLLVTTGATVRKIFIKEGSKLFASSSNTDDRLGAYLLRKGIINQLEFTQASNVVSASGQRMETVLISLGYLKDSELDKLVQEQIEGIILGLFNLEDGYFEFIEGPPPPNEPITLQVSTANLIYNGIKQINNFVLIKKMCPSLDAVCTLADDLTEISKAFDFEDIDNQILSLVDGSNSVKKILALSPTPNFETLKILVTFISIGLIHVREEDETPGSIPLDLFFDSPFEEEPEKPADQSMENSEVILVPEPEVPEQMILEPSAMHNTAEAITNKTSTDGDEGSKNEEEIIIAKEKRQTEKMALAEVRAQEEMEAIERLQEEAKLRQKAKMQLSEIIINEHDAIRSEPVISEPVVPAVTTAETTALDIAASEARIKEAEVRARQAEERARAAEIRARDAEERALMAEAADTSNNKKVVPHVLPGEISSLPPKAPFPKQETTYIEPEESEIDIFPITPKKIYKTTPDKSGKVLKPAMTVLLVAIALGTAVFFLSDRFDSDKSTPDITDIAQKVAEPPVTSTSVETTFVISRKNSPYPGYHKEALAKFLNE